MSENPKTSGNLKVRWSEVLLEALEHYSCPCLRPGFYVMSTDRGGITYSSSWISGSCKTPKRQILLNDLSQCVSPTFIDPVAKYDL